MNDKRSYTEYTVTTATTDFVIGFADYDDTTKDTIVVTVNGVLAESQGYAVMRKNAQVVTITPAVQSGTVRLERVTDIDASFHQFTAGALFSAKSVDENFEQVRHSQQEVRDGFTFLQFNTLGIVAAAKAATQVALDAAQVVADLVVGKVRTQDVLNPLGESQESINQRYGKDTGITTWSDRTQESKNRDTLHSKDFGIVPNSPLDQSSKLVDFLKRSGDLTLERGVYYMGTTPPTINLQSYTHIKAQGAYLDYSASTVTTTGHIKAYGANVIRTYNLSASTLVGTNKITLTSTVGLTVGALVYLKSSLAWSTDCKAAETLCITHIEGNTLTVSTTVKFNYAVGTTTLELRDTKRNIVLEGITLIGSGTQLVGGKNERAIQFNNVADCALKHVHVYNYDRMGILVSDAYNTNVFDSTVSLTKLGVGENYVQYCIALADALNGGVVERCTTTQGRHGVVYTTFSGYGYSVNHRVQHNNISKTTNCGIATHQTNADLFTQANVMTDCWGGLDIRVKNATSVNDKVIRPTYGYVLRSDVSNLKIVNSTVEDCFNAVYGAVELTGSMTTLDIFNLRIKNATNDGIKLVLPTGVSVEDLRLRHVCADGVSGEGISLSGAFTGGYIKDMQTMNQPSSRYGVRLAGTTSISVTGGHFGGRPVRSETYEGVNCKGTRVVGNQYIGDHTASSIASGNQVDAFSQGNIRVDASASKSVSGSAMTVSEGLGYAAVYVSSTTTLTTFTGSVATGETLLLTKAGSGTLTITAGGNLTLKAGSIVLTTNTQVVRFVFNGGTWLEV